MTRIGLGYDKHALVENRRLMVGGIEIPFTKGEAGHSDGDCLLHAIADSILGAAALGDIGTFFPPKDEKWKDADSIELLSLSWEKVKEAGWKIENIDCVLALEEPKVFPYRDKIRASIAKALNVDTDRIFVKGKTGEKLGKVGLGLAIEAWSVALLSK